MSESDCSEPEIRRVYSSSDETFDCVPRDIDYKLKVVIGSKTDGFRYKLKQKLPLPYTTLLEGLNYQFLRFRIFYLSFIY